MPLLQNTLRISGPKIIDIPVNTNVFISLPSVDEQVDYITFEGRESDVNGAIIVFQVRIIENLHY